MSPSNSSNPSGMSPGTRLTIRVIIAIVACLALLLPLSAGTSNFFQRVNTKESTETSALPADMSKLEVDAERARVQISTTPSPTGSATLEFRGTSSTVPQISLDTSGGITRVGVTGLDSRPFLDRDELRLNIEIPEAQAREMDVTSTSKFSHTVISGEYRRLVASTTTGMIEADVTAQALQLRATSGAIDVTGSAATVALETKVGAISSTELNVSEKLTASTSTGALDLRLGQKTVPTAGIEVSVNSGAVDLRVPRIDSVEDTEATGYRVDASTSSGASDVGIDEVPSGTEEPFVPITVRSDSGFVDIQYL
ncbi:hypothetical protein GCM10022261_19070 [Brevibacterium daeguense]|uniref:DUF4097 domain-containing protein n=1 Tax=Brevibacterium daeguense TaxID=909936 RepID=A0ABP8EK58_9MICO|nr:DUF4097 family beta strand repeat-containing protein [Brevibacterium daeguense]